MKLKNLVLATLAMGSIATSNAKTVVNQPIKSQVDTFYYGVGKEYGAGLAEQMKNFPGYDEKTVNKEAIIRGFVDAIYGDSIATKEKIRDCASRYMEEQIKKAQDQQNAEFRNFAKKYEKDGFKEMLVPAELKASGYNGPGILMKELKAGTGASIEDSNLVLVDYEGKLANDSIFDSTTGREPGIISPRQVIPGFSQALMTMKKGGKSIVVIPSALGYGPRAAGPIPANSTLIFTIEVKDIFPNEAAARSYFEKLHPEAKQGK